MHFGHRHYVPCVRWKQGEYDALLLLNLNTKNHITPLIEVPEIGYDFETQQNAKTIDKHLAKFGARLQTKWRHSKSFIDLNLLDPSVRMADGRHPVTFIFAEVAARGCLALPVTGVGRPVAYQEAVKGVLTNQRHGLCVRVSLEDAAEARAGAQIRELLEFHNTSAENCDLILDLGAPNFTPIDGFARLVESVIRRLPDLPRWQTFSLIGTAFPESMGQIKAMVERIPRNEWMLYKLLVPELSRAGLRLPSFGDYGVNHPAVLALDMRLVKPSASIRYTSDDCWIIVKGRNVRDYRFAQYEQLCQELMANPGFLGPSFSAGHEYIVKCAAGQTSTGNLTVWRRNGTNHHIEKVVRDIASFFDFLGIE